MCALSTSARPSRRTSQFRLARPPSALSTDSPSSSPTISGGCSPASSDVTMSQVSLSRRDDASGLLNSTKSPGAGPRGDDRVVASYNPWMVPRYDAYAQWQAGFARDRSPSCVVGTASAARSRQQLRMNHGRPWIPRIGIVTGPDAGGYR